MDSPESLLEALRPWLLALRAPYAQNGYRYIILPTNEPPENFRVFEALELLALLREINCNAWKQALDLLTPNMESLVRALEAASSFACQLSIRIREDQTNKWLGRVLLVDGLKEEDASPGYMDLRRRLEAAYALREKDTRSFEPKIVPRDRLVVPISVNLYTNASVKALCVLAGILREQQATSATSTQSGEFKSLLRVQWVTPGIYDHRSVSGDEMEYVIQIIEAGGRLKEHRLCDVDMSGPRVELVTRGLQLLLGCHEKKETRPLAEWDGSTLFGSRQLNRRAVEAVYSALSTSQTVAVAFVCDRYCWKEDPRFDCEDYRRHLWQWIAYAVFSRHATHRIREFVVRADDLRSQDVRYVSELLQHPHPLALLCSDGHAAAAVTGGTGALVVVTASRFLLSSPSADPAAQREMTLPAQQVSVIQQASCDRHEGYERVLLPGYGCAWVRLSDIEARVVRDAGLACRQMQLTFSHLNQARMTATLALLKLVGHQLTGLEIRGDWLDALVDAWLLDVLACCPQLERLVLRSVCLQSLDTLASAFETGLCRVESLKLTGCEVYWTLTAPAFFQKLADPDHAMTRSLRSIYLGCTAPARPWIKACKAVLASNFRLRSLSVHTESNGPKRLKFECKETDETPIYAREKPLDLHNKLAFLSVVTRDDVRVMTMDADATSLVFKFAATCEKRRVNIRISGTTEDEEDDQEEGV